MAKQQYLALYTGPNGPISAEFEATDLDDADRVVAENRSLPPGETWYDEAADALDLGADCDRHDLREALDEGQWELALPAAHSGEYSIYRKAD